MNWQAVAAVVGLLLLVEGTLLLLIRGDAWRRLCARLNETPVEQVHVAGAVMGVLGALLLLLGV